MNALDRRVVVVGSLNVDLVAFADRLPDAGETVAGTQFLQGSGGKGANQAVMAARFGAEVAFAGAVGDDPNGRTMVGALRAEGIDVDGIATVETTTGVASIWVDAAGQNRIVIVAGANGQVDGGAAAALIERVRPTVVVGQFEIPPDVTCAAFAAARAVGATTVLNPAPGLAISPALLDATDWLVPNETELALIGGPILTGRDRDDARQVEDYAVRLGRGLIVTLGPRGAVVTTGTGSASWIAAPRVEPVDTTGAGDAFVGAFAAGLAVGLPPVQAARLGCRAASDSVTRPGTQASYPSAADARAMLAEVPSA